MCVLLTGFGASSCRKIENPMPSDLKRTGFLFNYRIENPDVQARRPQRAVARRFEEGRLLVMVRGNIIPRGVIESYEKVSGVKIELAHYESNAEMHKRLTAGEEADLAICAGFMVQILAQQNLLHELNYANIANVSHIAPQFRSLPFDPGNKHSVAHLWQTVGIAYDGKVLDKKPEVWKDLFEPDPINAKHLEGKVALMASPHRIFAAALLRLGYSPNSRDAFEIRSTADYLRGLAPVRGFKLIPQEELAARMASHEIALALAHSAEAAHAAKKNPNIYFVVPHDGTWVSFDNSVILARADPRQKNIAEDFINFLLHPSVAAELANTSLEATTDHDADAFLSPAVKYGPSSLHPRDGWKALQGEATSDIQESVYQDLLRAQPGTATK